MTAKTVLLVDDEAPIRDAAAEALRRAGLNVAQATNGKEALEKIRSGEVDLVVLDVIMPEMTGWDVLKAVRRDEQLAGLPIVMLTILDSDENVAAGWAMGADYYLSKPFAPSDLVDVVTRLLAATEPEPE